MKALLLLAMLFTTFLSVYANAAPLVPASVDSTVLYSHVKNIVSTNGNRNYRNLAALEQVVAYIESTLVSFGAVPVEQPYLVNGAQYKNILVRIGSGPRKKVVVGAHYDVCGEQDGADDNASGVAGLLEVARILKQNESTLNRTFELAFYTLEEPPFFNSRFQGSYVHATGLSFAKEKLELMIAVEMIGYFTDEKNSQEYPLGIMKWFYPKQGNFIAVVGNFNSRGYVNSLTKSIKTNIKLACASLVAPGFITGIAFSDHANFWGYKYKALMITDSAFYRNKRYHSTDDVLETLSFGKMSQVVIGLSGYLLAM